MLHNFLKRFVIALTTRSYSGPFAITRFQLKELVDSLACPEPNSYQVFTSFLRFVSQTVFILVLSPDVFRWRKADSDFIWQLRRPCGALQRGYGFEMVYYSFFMLPCMYIYMC